MKCRQGWFQFRGRLFFGLCELVLIQGLSGMPSQAADNVYLHGVLVAEPCVIPAGEEEVSLYLGAIVDKYLYQHTRTLGRVFNIHLADCDISAAHAVKVTFTGTENASLPGLLAVEGNAGGIAIGLETLASEPILFNSVSDAFNLQAGSNLVSLRAYVQGEPQAIITQTIVPGAFSAVTTFRLAYE